jgi:hypothetical protein
VYVIESRQVRRLPVGVFWAFPSFWYQMVLDYHKTMLGNFIILNMDHKIIQVAKNLLLEQLLKFLDHD